MALGKIKDTWPILFVVIAAIVLVLFVFKKPAKDKEMVSYQTKEVTAGKTQNMASDAALMQDAAEKEPMMIHTHPKTTKTSGVFSIQVYSFKEEARAKGALTSIVQNGYDDVYVLVSDLGEKGIWHRVRVGYFDDEEEAKVLLQKLRSDFNSGIIVRN